MGRTPAHERDRRTPEAERRRIVTSKNTFWRPSNLAGADSTKQHLLANLVKEGELVRVRRGLYWRGIQTPLGMSPPPAEALFAELAPGPGVGPAGLSAANALKVSTQVPRQAEVALPSRAPSEASGVRFVSRRARVSRAEAGLTPVEVAMLEVLDSWERVIDDSPVSAWNRLVDLIASGNVNPRRIATGAATEPGSVRERLRALLASAGERWAAALVPAADPRTASAARRGLPALPA